MFPFWAIVAVMHTCANNMRRRREEWYFDRLDMVYKNKKFVATQFIWDCEYNAQTQMWENKKWDKVTTEFVKSHLDEYWNIITKF
jgi:hypothetical protein